MMADGLTAACELTAYLGSGVTDCADFIIMFGTPGLDVLVNYVITRDRICNE